ncbi:hypothetical protein BDF19DRAFT_435984 [Syncephalis fuscata]|nr:hypothetical protein BDF19DRAFT_435984 [Syncephalis fuscata]
MVNLKNKNAVLEHRVKSFRTGKNGWPYRKDKQLSPKQCALAGFFHDESSTDQKDAVQCFICQEVIEDWTPNTDDPFTKHITQAPTCAWVVLVCLRHGTQPTTASIKAAQGGNSYKKLMDASELNEDWTQMWIKAFGKTTSKAVDSEDEEELWQQVQTGQSARMEQWRIETFGNWWPHDGKRGWQVSSTKMAKAGFIYMPGPESDDAVVCVYCGVNLDGWEPKDDPIEEHKKRCAECPFFAGWPDKGKKTTRETSQKRASSTGNDLEQETKGKRGRKGRKVNGVEEKAVEDSKRHSNKSDDNEEEMEELTVEEYIKQIVEEQIARLKTEGQRLIDLLQKQTN